MPERLPPLDTILDLLAERVAARMPKATPPPILLDAEDAARALGLSSPYVLDLARRGDLPSVMVGKRRLFRPEALSEWARQREVRA